MSGIYHTIIRLPPDRKSPRKLFDIMLNYVAKNMEHVDSLTGFPSQIGELLFSEFVSVNTKARIQFYYSEIDRGRNCSFEASQQLHLFTDEYKEKVLSSVSLFGQEMFVNRNFKLLESMFTYVMELCLCDCLLGDDHDIIEHLAKLTELKKLCMKSNELTDKALLKLTLPCRMFGTGPTHLETLNLACNRFTDESVKYFKVFKNLTSVDLSSNSISDDGIRSMYTRYNMIPSGRMEHGVETVGWGAELLQFLKRSLGRARNNQLGITIFKSQRDAEKHAHVRKLVEQVYKKWEINKIEKLINQDTLVFKKQLKLGESSTTTGKRPLDVAEESSSKKEKF